MPEENKNNNNKLIAGVILALGAIAAFYFYGWDRFKTSPLPSQAEMRSSLLAGSTLNFAETAEAGKVATSTLPADFEFLLPREAFSTLIEEQTSGTGAKSYRVVFVIDENMHDHFMKIREAMLSRGWILLLAKRSDPIDIIEFANDQYDLRAETVFVTEDLVTAKNIEFISEHSQRSRVVIQIKQK